MDWWKGETKPAGRGDDGNMVSFDPDADPDGFSHFLAHHGFVVLDLLTSAEVDVTLDSFWDDMRARGSDKLARDDPTTWETENWPLRGKFLTDSGAMTQAAFDNRTNPKLYRAFRRIFGGQEHLYVKLDNWGIMRGSVFGEQDRGDWRWELQPHWDVNPWQYQRELDGGAPRMYQGLIALSDCFDDWRGTTGGFRVVPNCPGLLKRWCGEHAEQNTAMASFHPPRSDPLCDRLMHVPLRAGQMVIWDSAALHANFANRSSEIRIVQYVRMMDATCTLPSRVKHFPQPGDVPANVQLSSLGRKLLNIEKWA